MTERRDLVLTVAEDGSMTVEVDGVALLSNEDPWCRDSYGSVVDHATGRRRYAARVTVREADGSGFVLLLPSARFLNTSRGVSHSGFLPHEPVAVASIVRQVTADAAGLVNAPSLASVTGADVVLLGRVSGTLVVVPS